MVVEENIPKVVKGQEEGMVDLDKGLENVNFGKTIGLEVLRGLKTLG